MSKSRERNRSSDYTHSLVRGLSKHVALKQRARRKVKRLTGCARKAQDFKERMEGVLCWAG